MYVGPFSANNSTLVDTIEARTSKPHDAQTLHSAIRPANTNGAACDRFPKVDDILDRLTNRTDLAKRSASYRG